MAGKRLPKPKWKISGYAAELLYYSGRFEGAQTQARRAGELDPLSRIINSVYARAYLFARRYDEAITIFKKNR